MKNGWIFDSELFSHNQRVCSLAFLPITVNIGPWFVRFVIPIGSMYAIYGNIYHQYTPFMLAYIYIYTPYMDRMGLGFSHCNASHSVSIGEDHPTEVLLKLGG